MAYVNTNKFKQDYVSKNPVSDRVARHHNKTNPNLPDILSETQHDIDVAAFKNDPKKLVFAIRKNKYYNNYEQILNNKKEEIIDTEKKTYRDKVAAAWLTGLTKVITVNNGYETRFDGVIVPKTKKVTVTYKYNTVTKESIYT